MDRPGAPAMEPLGCCPDWSLEAAMGQVHVRQCLVLVPCDPRELLSLDTCHGRTRDISFHHHCSGNATIGPAGSVCPAQRQEAALESREHTDLRAEDRGRPPRPAGLCRGEDMSEKLNVTTPGRGVAILSARCSRRRLCAQLSALLQGRRRTFCVK